MEEAKKELVVKIETKLSELNQLLGYAYEQDLMVDIRSDYIHEIPRRFDRIIMSARILQQIG